MGRTCTCSSGVARTPSSTAWLTETHVALVSTVVYGLNLLGAAIAYSILQNTMAAPARAASAMREAFGRDLKGWVSPALYVLGIALAFVVPWLGLLPFIAVAIIWLVPDRRVERYLQAHQETLGAGRRRR